jgi:hypothetical protein
MQDIFETTIVCEACNKKTEKAAVVKDGHRLRFWHCPECNKKWYHPLDLQKYNDFQKIKHKQFHVKLRLVGNSYAISIPREIIDFQNEFNRLNKQMSQMISLCMEEPEKLSLFFTRKLIKETK